ncbi:DUF5719 family protein [Actinomyces howellii]|uniref:Prevent-host-death protein n=1 Tax=Actinomyces howellii TaxID=52771 RepID=A0A3S4RH29_9ACTO|nr:DUF5719 family protein [Actinomyces howellii]VEG29918.1 Uncharacterised protein [Actinomyces howellii]
MNRSRTVGRPATATLRRVVALVAATALVGAGTAMTWWGTTTPRPTTTQVEPATVTGPAADVVYACPQAPRNTIGGVDLGETTSSTTLTPTGQDATITYGGTELDAPTTLETAEGGLLTVEAGGTEPAGAVGAVTTLTASGDLRGLTTAPCTPPSAVSWMVGGSSAVGTSAELRLTNPGVTVVTATVRLYGSTGEIALPSNGQVVVPAGQTVGMLLESAGATDSRVALSVEADGGTLVPFLVTEALNGETAAGTEVISPGAAPSTDLTVPGVVLVEGADQGEASDQEATGAGAAGETGLVHRSPVVRVVNPGQEPATVAVSLIGDQGEQPLAGAESVVVDPGAVFDISLAGTTPGSYGVRVTSDAPVGAAVSLVRSAGEYPERSGTALRDVAWAQAASPGALEAAVVALPRGNGMAPALALTNSGTTPSTVTLTAADGQWTTQVEVPASTTVTPTVPEDVGALRITSSQAQDLSAAVTVTAQVEGEAAGTLVSTLSPVADAQALTQRNLVLR